MGIPEIKPLAASSFRPGGKPVALTRAAGLVPLANTWKVKGWPVRPVWLVPLVITGVAAGAWVTVRVSMAVSVPDAFEASIVIWLVRAWVGTPLITPVRLLIESPGGSPLAS